MAASKQKLPVGQPDGTVVRVLPPPGLLILGLAAAALVGIIGLELHDGFGPGKGPLEDMSAPVAPARQQSTDASVSRFGNGSGNQTARQVEIILARPLFSPSRRPAAPAAASQHDVATALGRLSGVIVSPSGKSAIFAGSKGGKPVVLGEGAHMGEYVVRSIDVGAVRITGPSGERILHLTFDPSPPPKSATPPPIPPPPAWAIPTK